jgi:AraC-like DNA-binding protein
MTTITFSSASLPEHLDDHRRFDLWRDIYTAQFGLLDFAISEQLAFSATMEITPLGAVALGRMRGTIERVSRTARDVAVDGRDDYCLVVNQGATMSGRLGRKNFELPGGGAVLMSNADSGSIARLATGGGDDWLNVIVPGTLLRQTMGNADDLVACATPGGSEALTLLAGYAALLQRQGTIASERLAQFATDTLLDLMALTLGAEGDTRELANARGLRAARLHAVLGQIQQRYADVGFSTRDIAAALRISARYVNDILQESGTGFSERVTELRLQRARALLADRRNDGMRIGDIAYAAGFADISHFNRSFRRRFGMTPTGAR